VTFNSIEFAIFLIVVVIAYHGLLRRCSFRVRKAFLLVASYVFYASWSPPFALLLLGSTLIDFVVAHAIERAATRTQRRLLLALSLGFNLGVLGFFKYGAFIAANTYPLFFAGDPPLVDLVLPIGISFYTFESLSYTIDVYRGAAASRSLLDFALFLSFFPHLVAGPIVRPRQLLPQLVTRPTIVGSEVEVCLARIAQGFLKKLILADGLGLYVDQVWRSAGGSPAGNVLLAFYAYAFQIYFDFSGYTDIAIGTAGLFGIRFPENFARPYLARDVREFWRRWHITLSTWLRDYLYVSLGGNRRGRARTYLNLLATMVLGGLWHGAAWNFVAWGAYHGALLAIHRARSERSAVKSAPGGPQPRALFGRLATFHLVCLGWLVFRAPSFADFLLVCSGLLRPGFASSRAATEALALVGIGVALHLAPDATRVRRAFADLPAVVQGLAYAVACIAAFLFTPGGERFIYFQF
jgi:D-alanyl-lipoteichoic acid acyltransferase DltB (MBOAT superfamily)